MVFNLLSDAYERKGNMVTDFILNIISYLPKLFNWWLYSPKRTERNVDVSISANESSIQILCIQNEFQVQVEFRNNNPFPIEIDRLIVNGHYYTVTLTASEKFGIRIMPKKKASLIANGKFNISTESQIKQAKDDTTIRLEVNALIINKCYRIRNFRRSFNSQLCRVINKNAGITETMVMKTGMTMIYWKSENHWLGKLLEHPEIVAQAETVEELEENIKDAYLLMAMDNVPKEHHTKEIAILRERKK